MKRNEQGFTLIELIIVIAIVAIIAGAATFTTFQVLNVTASSGNDIRVIRQVQNAGWWISQDALVAENIIIDDDPETPEFLLFSWTQWGYDEESIYHAVTYSFEDVSEGIGKLKRNYWISTGVDRDTLVAEYISYDPDDPVNTSNVSYQKPVLSVKLTSLFKDARETREYSINRRQNFN